MELKHWETDFHKISDLEKTQDLVLSSKTLPRLSPHPQAKEAATWILAGRLPLQRLPINAACLRPSEDSPALVTACFSQITTALLVLVAQMVKNVPAIQETQVRSLGQEDPLEKGMATHSSILAWRIPWTEEPGRQVYGVTEIQIWLND